MPSYDHTGHRARHTATTDYTGSDMLRDVGGRSGPATRPMGVIDIDNAVYRWGNGMEFVALIEWCSGSDTATGKPAGGVIKLATDTGCAAIVIRHEANDTEDRPVDVHVRHLPVDGFTPADKATRMFPATLRSYLAHLVDYPGEWTTPEEYRAIAAIPTQRTATR